MRPRRVAAALTAGFAVIGIPAACRSTGPSPESWAAAADEICVETQKDAEQSRPVLTTPSMLDLLRRSSDLSKRETNALRDLDRPSDKRDEVRDYLSALDERTTAIDVHVASLNGGLGAATDLGQGLEDIADATQKAADLAKALGLEVCLAGIDITIADAAGTEGPGGFDGGQAVLPDDTALGSGGPPSSLAEYNTTDEAPPVEAPPPAG